MNVVGLPLRSLCGALIVPCLASALALPVAALQAPDAPVRAARALRFEQRPLIDGRLDDPDWQRGELIDGFVQRVPQDGAPASERTHVRIGFDDNALYVGAWLFDTDADAIVLGETRRDAELDNSDAFRIVLDTYLDRQNGFVFGTTPAGIEFDGQITREGQGGFTGLVRQQAGSGGGFNLNWDGSWEVATSRDSLGWYAEFRIPFSTLRYARTGEQEWGLNFARRIRRRNEESIWSPIPRQFDFYRVSMAGRLAGVQAPALRPFTITPYSLVSQRREYSPAVRNSSDWEIGGDAKLGITPSLSLDATINTDFAQVEVDEQQINLSRFSLFFPEKRPFFLENAGTFAFGSAQEVEIFFSRRIGIESGRAVPILAGSRLTGRAGGFNIGLLDMQTESDNNYGAARILRELGNRTRVGAIITSRVNTTATDDRNFTYGLDGRLGVGSGLTIDGYWAHTTDRPVERTGAAALSASYVGRSWDWGGTYRQVGAGFDPDVGFVSRSDYRFYSARLLRRIRFPATSALREMRPHVSYREHTDWGGFSETRLIHIDSHFEFANGAFFQLPAINFTREGLEEPFEIAPGVTIPSGTYDNLEWGFDYNTDRSAPLSIDGRIDIGGFYSGHRAGGETTVAARVGDAFAASLRTNYYRVWLPEGDFETAVLGLRVAYSFTPRVYLQALLQYNDQTQSLSSNLRFGWLATAATGLYIVYNDLEHTTLDRWRGPVDRGLVIKFTRQFDLTR